MCALLWEFKWYNIILITEHKLLEVQYNRHTLTCLYIMATQFSQSIKYDIQFNCEVNITSIHVYNESVLNGNIFVSKHNQFSFKFLSFFVHFLDIRMKTL